MFVMVIEDKLKYDTTQGKERYNGCYYEGKGCKIGVRVFDMGVNLKIVQYFVLLIKCEALVM